ncbi:histidine--tRNA ligase, partial [Buchnera aphidicola]|nr:histidine--tRNA ligase [Buchnera aphidicola]
LEINSIGSPQDRCEYKKNLILFFQKHEKFLDADSKKRLYTNPLRILDSKNKNIQEILKEAPSLSQYINSLSKTKFKNLCDML